jgi:flagellar protein FlaG
MNVNANVENDWGVRRPDFQAAASSVKPAGLQGYKAEKPEKAQFDREALKSFIGALEKFSQTLGVSLKLHFHEPSNTIQAEIRDGSGQKVLRQIPPDEILDLAVSIRKLSGLLAQRSL